MFSNRTKYLVLLGFTAIILLMTAVVLVGFKQMNEISNDMELIVNQNNAKTTYITAMYTAARERSISLLRMLQMDDPFDQDEEYLHFNELATQFAVARIALGTLPFDKQETAYSEEQYQLTQQAVPHLESVIDFITNNKKEEATKVLLDKAIPAQDKVLAQLSAMLAYQSNDAKKSLKSAKQSHRNAIQQISFLALGALLLSSLIIWFVFRFASRAKEATFAQVALESIGDAVITTNDVGKINYINPVAEKMTGWRSNKAKDKSITDVFNIKGDNTESDYKEYIQDALNNSEFLNISHQAQLRNRNNEFFSIEFLITPILSNTNKRIGTALSFRNISQEQKLRKQLTYQACHDALTDLLNRYEFEKRLKAFIKSSIHENTNHVLLYLDLDKFKVINDTCGHVAGDELLRQVATLFQDQVRSNDTIARLGGDEFGIIFEDCKLEKAVSLANKILRAVQEFHFGWEDKSFHIGVSIGVVEINCHCKDITNVMAIADAACYSAKDSGRDRIHIAQEGDIEIANRRSEMQWASKIEHALVSNNFELFYQAIVPTDSANDSSYGIELLLRMKDGSGDFIPPGAFIPSAERYNLMTQVDHWVIDNAFKWLANNPKETTYLHKCAINLSGQTIGNEASLDYIKDKFKQYDINPEKVCFEITETAAISNLAKATKFIYELKKRGCFFSLDDFGSGLSSFAYLKNLPVDFIKIDGMFVRDIAHDSIDSEMVRSITGIAKAMGKLTIAEFVENDKIKNILLDIGVDYIQGYGVAKPQPLSSLSIKNLDTIKKIRSV